MFKYSHICFPDLTFRKFNCSKCDFASVCKAATLRHIHKCPSGSGAILKVRTQADLERKVKQMLKPLRNGMTVTSLFFSLSLFSVFVFTLFVLRILSGGTSGIASKEENRAGTSQEEALSPLQVEMSEASESSRTDAVEDEQKESV